MRYFVEVVRITNESEKSLTFTDFLKSHMNVYKMFLYKLLLQNGGNKWCFEMLGRASIVQKSNASYNLL